LVGWRILPRKYDRTEKPLDKMGLGSLAGILLALAYAISVLDTSQLSQSLLSWRVINSMLVIALLIPLLIRSSRTAADPVIRVELFRNRQVAISLLVAIGAGICEAAFIYFPTIAVLAYNVTMSEASFMLLPLMFSVAIGSPIAGRLLDKTGSKLIILSSMVLLALGMLGISTSPGSLPVFYLASVFIGLGLAALLGSALSYILIHEAKPEERATSQGVITLFISIGQLISAAMVGAIAASAEIKLDGFRTAFAVIVVVTFIISGTAFFLKNKSDEQKMVLGTNQSKRK
ncbi:MAG: MFS transporter, partial [Bacteroidetes bacterium]|nr:MFS transporter [Bacteroidota bacterium]